MKKFILSTLSYVLVAVLAATVALAIALPQTVQSNGKLQQLEQMLLTLFVDGADAKELEDAAANAMVGALGDRWSYYIPADQYASYMEQMNNAYVGIGVTIQQLETGGFEITKLEKGGPALEAGVQIGDVLIAVEGQDVRAMTVAQCRDLVRGEVNSQVQLTFLREQQELTVTVTRKTIQTPVATAKLLENNVGLVTIVNFDERCYSETAAKIEQLRKEGAQSLIFDVRFNPGGYQRELVKLLDYLLPEGELFHSYDAQGNVTVDRSDAKFLDMPMAVLVNGSSYSAAEFFAAALQEYEAAVIVGEQTSGKGYFQRTYQLLDGSAVSVSVGKYTTPKDVSLEGVGITPDVQVAVDERTAALIQAGQLDPMEDPQILAALAALQG